MGQKTDLLQQLKRKQRDLKSGLKHYKEMLQLIKNKIHRNKCETELQFRRRKEISIESYELDVTVQEGKIEVMNEILKLIK